MLDLSDMTSPLRVGLAAAIVTHVRAAADLDLSARLARDLTLRPFEERGHDDMIDMAQHYGVPETRITECVTKHEAQFSPLVARHLCRVCCDERLVQVEIDGVIRFARCPECNTPVTLAKFDDKAPTL